MRFLSDSRAQSVQIGAVLLFGILIILLSTWQAFVIPNQNQEVEFNHNERVQQQMTDLRSTVISMPGADTPQSVTVDLGLRYPSRTIFRNPPPVSGTIQTLDTTNESFNVTIRNAEAQNDDFGQLWARDGATYNTGAIEYRPSYNEYESAPRTIYSGTVLYNAFDRENQQLPVSGQSLVRGNRISVVALNGSLSENGVRSRSLDFEPLSTQTREVEIEPEPGERIVLELPTRLGVNRWRTLFESEPNVNSSAVTLDQSAFGDEGVGLLRVPLRPDPVGSQDFYRLQLAKVGIGTGTTTPNAAYLTPVEGNGTEIQRSESVELTLEVRDAYNRPVSGQRVFADAEAGTITNSEPTDTSGQATFTYQTDSTTSTGTTRINFSIDGPIGAGYDRNSPTNVTMEVAVTSSQNGGGGNSAYSTTWQSPSGTGDNTGSSLTNCDAEDCTWDVGASGDDTLTLRAATSPTIEGASLDFSVDNSTVGSITPGENTTTAAGEATTELTAKENGTVGIYTASGGSSDVINVTVENVTAAATTDIAMRVDDLTNRRANEPRFYVSYDVGVSHDNVEIIAESTESSASAQATGAVGRDGRLLAPGFGNGEEFEITVRALESGSTVAERTFVTNADTQNPAENDDLSRSSSAQLLSSDIVDRSKPNQNEVIYRFDWDVSSGDFSEVELLVLNRNGNGASTTQTTNVRQNQNVDVEPGDGTNTVYKVGLLVRDSDGVVVDSRTVEDTAEGNGP
ncbi:hypothetical protein GRX03_12965 [Halovenus sp. WSH3]|uniref:Big-1 domain-containing protein n=1 Tax=Halovenus carboxidivorans TaxID=2692199 RepID=A0A6B0T359_9EURY|nr:Ig-like domain-containing protein [Halovenus carboxidivorans]MXR52514.1 hypothetical protein [Halovenus carboxidivorans]